LRHRAEEAEKPDLKELSQRMATAFNELGFFIFDKSVDDVNEVMQTLRRAGVEHIVEVRRIGGRAGLYIVEPRDGGCRSLCRYERGCRDEDCLRRCIDECSAELRRKVAEALRRIARRQ